MAEWTMLDDIERVEIEFINGESTEIEVNAIICNPMGMPLWVTYLDDKGQEVIILCTVIQLMTILSRKELGPINGQQVT